MSGIFWNTLKDDEDFTSYLLKKYKMYLMYESGGSNRKGKPYRDSDIDFTKVVCRFYSEHKSAKNDHDFSSDYKNGYFLSDDIRVVKEIKKLDSYWKEPNDPMRISVPMGDKIDDYFKPIFRDLASKFNFEDPNQHEYNLNSIEEFESILRTIKLLDHSKIESPKRTYLQYNYSYKNSLKNLPYYLESKLGAKVSLILYFDPRHANGWYVVVDNTCWDIQIPTTGKKLHTKNNIENELEEFFIEYEKEKSKLKIRASQLVDQFPFLKVNQYNEFRIEMEDAFGFNLSLNKDIILSEEVHNLGSELHEPGVFREKAGKNTDRIKFNNVASLEAWLSDLRNIKPFFEFQEKIAHLRSLEESKKSELTCQLKKFTLKEAEDFKLNLVRKNEYGVMDDFVQVSLGDEVIYETLWVNSWTSISNDDFKRELALIIVSALSEFKSGFLLDNKNERRDLGGFNKSVKKSLLWHISNFSEYANPQELNRLGVLKTELLNELMGFEE